jgi:protein-disulfide isomerase
MRASARLRGYFVASAFAVLSLALVGASCDKQSAAHPPTGEGPNVPFETPSTKAGGGASGAQAAPTPAAPAPKPGDKPAPGPAAPISRFDTLAEKLPSPCGKAESLKKTLEGDPSCKRGSFARSYLERLIKIDLSDDEIKEFYGQRYAQKHHYDFDLKDTPSLGSPTAPVVLVEFFDYGCPHCRDKRPVLEKLAAARPNDVVIYYKHFPLKGPGHENSLIAAHAAVAAFRQGKFLQMHEKLFANQGNQSKDELFRYAKELGLDMDRFAKDFDDQGTAAKVEADKAEGERADLQGTPTIYFNGRPYTDPISVEDLSDWIDEEMTVMK